MNYGDPAIATTTNMLLLENTRREPRLVGTVSANQHNHSQQEMDDRGLVSGHELAHIYGQEGHIDVCRSPSACNIMDTWGSTNFWFTEYTKMEIWTEFYFKEEWDGPNPS